MRVRWKRARRTVIGNSLKKFIRKRHDMPTDQTETIIHKIIMIVIVTSRSRDGMDLNIVRRLQ